MVAGVPVVLGCDYLKHRSTITARRKLIFTGPIDEFFNFDLGKLQYRGQIRAHRYVEDVDYAQPCGQVNAPLHQSGKHIRTLEWKHMMQPHLANRIRGTVLTTETPHSPENPNDYEYPFPDQQNAQLYKQYRERAESMEDVLICGRLGEYRYYD